MILLSAGHGGKDPGAVNKQGRKEADIAVEMRNMVAYYLREWGVSVDTDGNGKTNLSLRKALRLIGLRKPQISVEFHTNASVNATAAGVEVLAQRKDVALSQDIAKAISNVLGTKLRGRKGWKPENAGQHSRLAFVRSGGLIVELFFITNPGELKSWDVKKWLVAKAVAKVLLQRAK